MVFLWDKLVGAEFRKSERWENVFNGRRTTSGRVDKQRPQLDSARRICLGSAPHKSSDCSVDGLYWGKTCWGGIPKIGKWENVFNGGATTSGRMDKRRSQLDSARQIGLRCTSHEVLTVVVDVSTGGEICWAEIRKTER